MYGVYDQLVKDYKADPKRVYISGFSMGGMFSYHAMGKIADKIAAFAPCSGYLMQGAGTAMRPVPIFHVHGTDDKVVGYDGLENNLKSYRQQFNCPSQAEVYVKHLKLQGRQHSPSKADVSDIWNFVKMFSLDGVSAPIEVPTNRDTVFNGSFSDSLKLAGWTLRNHSGEGSLKFTDGKAEISVTKVGSNAYDVQMIQNGMHYENGRISINAGLATGSVFIDNVVLTKIDKVEPPSSIAGKVLLQAGEKTFSVYNMKGVFVCKLKATYMGEVQARLNAMNLDKGLYVVKTGDFSRIFPVK